MKTYIRRRETNRELIIVFGGWGTDQNAFIPLCDDNHDFILYYNYSADEPLILPEAKTYDRIVMIGWSLGVWAAEYMFASMKLKPDLSIAINGTPIPADNRYGIPVDIIEGTLKNLTEVGMRKFNLRLFGGKSMLERNLDKVSKRSVNSFRDELRWMYNRIMETNDQRYKWDIAFTSIPDRVFPYKNLTNYWSQRDETKIISMDLPHYPFFHWNSFSEMIDDLSAKV